MIECTVSQLTGNAPFAQMTEDGRAENNFLLSCDLYPCVSLHLLAAHLPDAHAATELQWNLSIPTTLQQLRVRFLSIPITLQQLRVRYLDSY